MMVCISFSGLAEQIRQTKLKLTMNINLVVIITWVKIKINDHSFYPYSPSFPFITLEHDALNLQQSNVLIILNSTLSIKI